MIPPLRFARHWPVYTALAIYWATLAVLIHLSVRQNAGHFVYPLDDAYIHMAMARNVAQHDVWGVTRYGFTSSSSSPLWTALLAAIWWLFGIAESTPVVLNILFGSLLVVISYSFLKPYVHRRLTRAGILTLVVLITPLPTLTLIGMEHVLQTLIAVCFVRYSIAAFRPTNDPGRDMRIGLVSVAAIVTAVRYEGLLLVGVVSSLLLWKRRYGMALAVAAAAVLPPLAYGSWSMAHGWWFLPNSVLLKGKIPALTAWGVTDWLALGLKKLAIGQLLAIWVASLFTLTIIRHDDDEALAPVWDANVILAAVIPLHALLASAGQFFRYEAYLVCLGVLIVGASAVVLMRTRSFRDGGHDPLRVVLACALAGVLVLSGGQRVFASLRHSVTATTNIYEQQYQMGLFLRRFYEGRTIVANDIGAISYLADIRLIDAWGLATIAPARRRLAGTYDTRAVFDLSRDGGGTIAIVYGTWFQPFGGLPPDWLLVGRWTIQHNVVCGSDTVSFYAVDVSAGADLKANLALFSRDLPRQVAQQGAYLAYHGR